jgi:xylulose-5-phosphate/fructose-6-phosphate phosphoketolase
MSRLGCHKIGGQAAYIQQACRDKLIEHREYMYAHGEDLPEIRDWTWKS